MVKFVLLAKLCTLAFASAQFVERVPQRLRKALVVKSTPETQGDEFGRTESKLDALPIRYLQLSMSMASEISVLADDIVDDDEATGGPVDWICRFCPSYLCVNCA
ncbi:hypothetical protein ACHAXA_011053 [Cyclostephanos tholiformis]|jgi:hypothetical protein|uniref:Secreted protein n=1 Tax=Cyclostephanos tholiformis TaxID=382380 RepID=A0ABD3RYV6_9STRA